MSDFARRASAHRLDAGDRPQILQHRGGVGLRQAGEQFGDAIALAGGGFGGLSAGEFAGQRARPREGALQPRGQGGR